MSESTVAVIGAGIAGLTAAIALRREGLDVVVYEAAESLQEIGAGVTLAPNAMRGMAHIGVLDAVVEAGVEPGLQTIAHWQHGETLLPIDRRHTREQYGIPYVYMHRADLQSILSRALLDAGGRLEVAHRLHEIDWTDSQQPRLCFSNGREVAVDLVIGADGLKSRVRGLFESPASQFTGHIAYRALAPVSEETQHLVDIPGLHIGPGKMVVRYPMRNSTVLNLVFFARQSGWTEDGWSIGAEVDELRGLYGDWCADVACLIDALQPETLHKWAINAHSPLSTWSLHDRVVLIGDAAHAMTPFLGQGAAMAIEDAVVLARALGRFERTQALEHYEAARRDRAHFVQNESNLNADRLQGPETELFGMGNLRNEETLGLFDYDCRSVAL